MGQAVHASTALLIVGAVYSDPNPSSGLLILLDSGRHALLPRAHTQVRSILIAMFTTHRILQYETIMVTGELEG